MLSRACKLPPRRSCFLFGPRQTGKSTLVRSILPRGSWIVDLLEHETFLRYAKDPGLFGREAEARIRAGATTVFVDEVQKLPALLDEVHALIERTGARFILTGSSARKLRRGGANLLAGRAAVRRLHPLTMQEQGERFDLGRTLRFGSLPAVATGSEAAARDLLRAYGETYLREELIAEALVRNLGAFARFLDVVAAGCGEVVNASAVARDCAVAARTVQEYFRILEDTLIGFRLEPWTRSPRAQMVSHPRFYLFDTGVTNALARRLDAEVTPERSGRLFEQWVVLECLRLIDIADSEARLYYWRTHHGAEVDLLVELHGKLVLAAEIKSRRSIAGADLHGLRSFAEAHPGVPRVVVSTVPEAHRLGDVEVLPYREFLVRIESLLRRRRSR